MARAENAFADQLRYRPNLPSKAAAIRADLLSAIGPVRAIVGKSGDKRWGEVVAKLAEPVGSAFPKREEVPMDPYQEIKNLLKDLKPQWTLHVPADAADIVFGHGDEAADVMEELAGECNCDIRFRQHIEGRPESVGFTFTKRPAKSSPT